MTSEYLNWNGFCSAQPPGLEFWSWSKSAAVAADDLVEEALKRIDAELSSKADAYADAESYGEAEYHLVEEPASFARSGLFCQLAGSFEFALLALCNDAATAASAEPLQTHLRSEIVLGRLRYLKDKTGVDFPQTSSEVLVLTRLRNVFAHADGILMSESDRPSIETWIREHSQLADADGHAIKLKEGFVRYCIATYDRKLQDIAIAVTARMKDRSAKPPHAGGSA